jgi:hypothetical protein
MQSIHSAGLGDSAKNAGNATPTNGPIDIPYAVRPREACKIIGCGPTRLYEILPELESYLDGKSRLITLRSIRARQARLIAEERDRAGNSFTARATAARIARRNVRV